MQVDHGAGAVLRPQRFAFSLGVMRNDGVRSVQNILRRAIILLQTNDRRILKRIFKAQNVFDRRTAEFVDALVVVADHAEVAAFFGQHAHKCVLRMVCVLILVNH